MVHGVFLGRSHLLQHLHLSDPHHLLQSRDHLLTLCLDVLLDALIVILHALELLHPLFDDDLSVSIIYHVDELLNLILWDIPSPYTRPQCPEHDSQGTAELNKPRQINKYIVALFGVLSLGTFHAFAVMMEWRVLGVLKEWSRYVIMMSLKLLQERSDFRIALGCSARDGDVSSPCNQMNRFLSTLVNPFAGFVAASVQMEIEANVGVAEVCAKLDPIQDKSEIARLNIQPCSFQQVLAHFSGFSSSPCDDWHDLPAMVVPIPGLQQAAQTALLL